MTFHVIMANVRSGVTIQDVQNLFQVAGRALSWYRIGSNVWVVHSIENAVYWATLLRTLTDPGGSVFVGKLDSLDTYGWVDPAFWDWLRGQTGPFIY